MGLILPIRPKLVFPGTTPGLNYAHPASTNLLLSAVPAAGATNYVNLVTGAPCTNLSGTQLTPQIPALDGIVGPALNAPTGGQALGISNTFPTAAAITVAAIFRYTFFTTGFQSLVVLQSANKGLWINSGKLAFFGSNQQSTYTFILGHAYFIAASTAFEGAGSPTPIYMVICDLSTGQVYSETKGPLGQLPYAIGNATVGNDISNEFANFPIAAAMAASTSIALPELLQWANDPWSFWYPNQFDLADSLAGPAAAPVGPTLYEFLMVGCDGIY